MAAVTQQKIVRKSLSLMLFIEAAAGVILFLLMLPTFPEAGPNQPIELPIWMSLAICLAVAVIWAAVTAVGAWRATGSWVRGSTVTIHVLMIAAGTGVLQGIMGEHTNYGTWLIVLGALGIIGALIWKPRPAEELTAADGGNDQVSKG